MKQSFSSLKTSSVPLQLILIVPFVLQVFGAVGLVGYLSLRNGQKAVNEVSSKLRQEMSHRIHVQVLTYLENPYIVGQTIVAAAQEEQLDLTDVTKLEGTFWRLVSQGTVEFMQIGMADGTSIVVEQSLNKGIVASVGSQANLPERKIYQLNDRGQRIALLETQAQFDPRTRPWYKTAQEARKPTWTSQPFLGKSQKGATIAISQPIYNRDGTLLGVGNNSFRIGKIYGFLSGLKVGKTGQTFIMDRAGNLIASSTIEEPYIIDFEKNKLQQIPAVSSESSVIRATAQAVLDRFGSFNIAQDEQLDFMLVNQRQFVHVSSILDKRGIDWLSIVVVPESDFMAQIDANTQTTILLCLGALGLATLVGIYTSRWASGPILKLQKASEEIASGTLDQRVEVTGISELEALAGSFNQMAENLALSQTILERKLEELNLAKETAEIANHTKSEFLANMNHELRTPLNGILGYTQILQRDPATTSKQMKGLGVIYQCGSHLLTLINDILDLSKLEVQKMELYPQDFHLSNFLSSTVDMCRIKAGQKGVEFHYQPASNLPTAVHADDKRLRQVLLNLLSNAVKFTDFGTVTFRVEPVGEPSEFGGVKRIRFQIKDTGIGIAPEKLSAIFLPFEQAGKRDRNTEGTGLGLAISNQIIQKMGSTIQVQSLPAQGSIFWFEIDLLPASDWTTQNAIADRKVIGYQGERRKILVIDDREENRLVAVNMLEPLGFKMAEAENGQTGLDIAIQMRPDLIITDVHMAVMDGLEMTRRLRQLPDFASTPIIASPATLSQVDIQESLDAGCNSFFPKPIEFRGLLAELQRHLELHWIYAAEPEATQPVVSNADEVRMMTPPAAELIALYTAAQGGFMTDIQQEAHRLKQLAPEYTVFANRVLELSQQFDEEGILRMIEPQV